MDRFVQGTVSKYANQIGPPTCSFSLKTVLFEPQLSLFAQMSSFIDRLARYSAAEEELSHFVTQMSSFIDKLAHESATEEELAHLVAQMSSLLTNWPVSRLLRRSWPILLLKCRLY